MITLKPRFPNWIVRYLDITNVLNCLTLKVNLRLKNNPIQIATVVEINLETETLNVLTAISNNPKSINVDRIPTL